MLVACTHVVCLLLRVLLYWVNLDLFRRADGGGDGCVQLVDKDPEKAIALFWGAINAGDRVDSALKDMAIVMKQQNRAEEAIEAIKSLRSRCSDQAQESLDNILLDLYKRCGRLDDQISASGRSKSSGCSFGSRGCSQDCDTIQVTSAGRLRLSKPNKYWVENSQKRHGKLGPGEVICGRRRQVAELPLRQRGELEQAEVVGGATTLRQVAKLLPLRQQGELEQAEVVGGATTLRQVAKLLPLWQQGELEQGEVICGRRRQVAEVPLRQRGELEQAEVVGGATTLRQQVAELLPLQQHLELEHGGVICGRRRQVAEVPLRQRGELEQAEVVGGATTLRQQVAELLPLRQHLELEHGGVIYGRRMQVAEVSLQQRAEAEVRRAGIAAELRSMASWGPY
ncbi:hypothetical protein ACQ4PT_026870 [Festuca glaucescens]